MVPLFDERPVLSEHVRLRDSADGPLLVHNRHRRALLLSEEEASQVACMDGSLTLEAIAAKTLRRRGRVSYAGLVHLVQALAVGAYLRDLMPRLGILARPPRLRWIFDLPMLMVPGVGGAAPRLSRWLTEQAVVLSCIATAMVLGVPHVLPLLDDPSAVARVDGSWELAVLVLFAVGFAAGSSRGVCRAAWQRARGLPPPAAGLRLRAGLLVFDVADNSADELPPADRAEYGRAGLLGLGGAAVVAAFAAHFLPGAHHTAAPYALVPLLLIFVELCPALPTDGARLAAPLHETPHARRALTAVLLRGSWLRATVAVFREDRRAMVILAWLAGAALLFVGPLRRIGPSWGDGIMHAEAAAIGVLGALPVVAWTIVALAGGVALAIAPVRVVLLARVVRGGRVMARRRIMPDDAAPRVFYAVLPEPAAARARRLRFEDHLVVRVVADGERLDDDATEGALLAVASGSFSVRDDTGGEIVSLGPGDVFARGVDVGDGARGTVTLIARQRGRVVVLPGAQVDAITDRRPAWRRDIAERARMREAVRASSFFASVSGRAVDGLVAKAERLEFPEGDDVRFVDEAASRDLVVIARGRLITSLNGQGPPIEYGPGDVVGIDGLLTGQSPPLVYRAPDPVELVRLPFLGVVDVLERSASLGLALETAAAIED